MLRSTLKNTLQTAFIVQHHVQDHIQHLQNPLVFHTRSVNCTEVLYHGSSLSQSLQLFCRITPESLLLLIHQDCIHKEMRKEIICIYLAVLYVQDQEISETNQSPFPLLPLWRHPGQNLQQPQGYVTCYRQIKSISSESR